MFKKCDGRLACCPLLRWGLFGDESMVGAKLHGDRQVCPDDFASGREFVRWLALQERQGAATSPWRL